MTLNNDLIEHVAHAVGIDTTLHPDSMDPETLLERLSEMAGDTEGDYDVVRQMLRAASEFVDNPKYVRVHVGGIDAVYAVLDEARDELVQAQQAPGTDDPETARDYIAPIINAVLDRFPDNEALLRWTGSAIAAQWGGWVDDQHDVWTAENPDAEDYAEEAVQDRLGTL